MAYNLAQAYVQIVPNMEGVGKAISRAFGDAGDKAGSKAGISSGAGFAKGFGVKLGAVAGIASQVAGTVINVFSGLSTQILDASDSTQKFAQTLQFAGISDEEIRKLTDSTQEYANKTVYGIDDIRNTTAQLAANGVPDYDRLAEAAGNLNAVAGGNAETFKSVAMMLTQTAGAGKLTTENWNQLADAIPGASGKLQDAMKANGAYTGNFREAMEKGEITADEFNQALMQLGMTDVAKQAAESTSTFEGAFGNLEATIVDGSATIVNTVKPAITGLVNLTSQSLGTALAKTNQFITKTVKYLQSLYARLKDNGAITAFKAAWDTIRDTIKNVANMVVDWTHMAPPPDLADMIGRVALAFQGLTSLILKGDFTSALRDAFDVEEDSPLVDMALTARDAVIDLVSNLDRIVPAIAPAVAAFLGFKTAAAGITTLSNGLQTVGGIADGVAANAERLSGGLNALAGNITLVSNAQKAWTSTTTAAAAVQKLFSSSMGGTVKGLQAMFKVLSANPFALIAAGVAAVVAALVLFFTKTETGRRAWQSLMDFLKPLWDQVQSAWQGALPALQSLMGSLGDAVSGLVSMIGPLLQQMAPMLGMLLKPITANLPMLQQAFGQLMTALQQSFTQLQPVFAQLGATFMQLMPVFAQLASTVIQLGVTLAQALAPVLQVILQAVAGFAPVILTLAGSVLMILPAIVQIATTLMSLLLPVIQQIVTFLAAFIPVIAQVVTTLIGMLIPVITAIVNIITALIPVITQVVTVIISVVQPIVQAIIGVIQGVTTVLQGVITFLTGVFSGDWSAAWAGIQQVFSGVWQAIGSLFTGIWNALQAAFSGGLAIIQSLWSAAWNAVSSAFSSIWNGIRNAASAGIDGVVGIVTGVKDRITGFFSGAGQWLVSAGQSIIQGLVDGITGMIDKAGSAISGVMDKISSFLPHSPAKEGPFSGRGWTPYSGQAIVEGLAQGITAAAPVAAAAMSGAMGEVSAAADTAAYRPDMRFMPQWADSRTDRTRDQQTADLDERILDELRAFHEDMPLILQSLGISIDGREFGRLTRKYAYATA